MNNHVDYTPLTTKQAAQLVYVHESSVKRWCKEGNLSCDITEGGHRRIALQDLLDFAETRNMPCLLGVFNSNAQDIWHALRQAQHKDNFDLLFHKAYQWLRQPAPDLFSQLVLFCLEQGIHFSVLFDAVIARALRQLGVDWQNNELDIGTEHYITEIIRDVLHMVRLQLKSLNEHASTSDTDKHAGHNTHQTTSELRAIVGSNAGNMHDIGAQAIRIILELKGWKTIYLGANVPVTDFAKIQARHKAQLVCISFISSNMISEAGRFIDVLARFYDDSAPYHLAIGGHLFPADARADLIQPPFEDVNVYRSTYAFDQWLDQD